MKGPLVSDTGPLIALAAVDSLAILYALYQPILVPEAVHQEVLEGGRGRQGHAAYQKASWLQIHPLEHPPDPLLNAVLDRGEAAVIQLARERHVAYVLIDERKGRKIARSTYGLHVLGTAGLLVVAKENGLVESVGDVLQQMRHNGYYIHDEIVTLALKKAGECESR